MSTLDELKQAWAVNAAPSAGSRQYDPAGLAAIAKARGAQHINRAMHYFWASLALQILVYGMLSHLFIRFWGVALVQGLCLAGGLLYLPFTIVLLRQFKQVAQARPTPLAGGFSIQARLQQQYDSLRAFYQFKRGYEYVLIPLSTALGVWLTFRLYVPGGVAQHLAGVAITYLLSLLACAGAIQRENRHNFEQPLRMLKDLLEEFSH